MDDMNTDVMVLRVNIGGNFHQRRGKNSVSVEQSKCSSWLLTQGSKLALANSRNTSGFSKLRV